MAETEAGRRTPVRALLVLWLFACCGFVFAAPLPLATPEALGLSPSGLAALTARLQTEVDAKRISGAVGLLARHGRIGYFQAVGWQDIDAGTAMTTNSIFRIASMTKAVTSAAIMMLVEEGTIQLSDSVSDYLPAFDSPRLQASEEPSEPPTIHELMTHTSGLTYGWFGPAELDRHYHDANVTDPFQPVNESNADRMTRLAKLPLKCKPGTAFDYGLSHDVLGRVIEVVSGLTLEQFLFERFLRPLQMRDTHFYLPSTKLDRLAALYRPADDGSVVPVGSEPVQAGWMTFTADYCHTGSRRFFSGGGGLVSSTLDYARFLQMLLNGGELGEVRLLQEASVNQITHHQIGELQVPFGGHGDGFGYGLGVLTERGLADDVASVGTFSWGGIFNTYFWVDPQEELIGLLMTQLYPFDQVTLREDFKRLAYEAIDDSGFARLHWYEKGPANPFFNPRQLRVNSPGASTHPTYASRSEPRSSGLARIQTDEDLRNIRRADLYLEVWGGHPGTADKRVIVNGRHRYPFPIVGTELGHCTHQYPQFNLSATDLVRGFNALQFACDDGHSFWGHYIVDNACLKIGLKVDDPELVRAGITDPELRVQASTRDGAIALRLTGPSDVMNKVLNVAYQGRYFGYDENGNGWQTDWHGMTRQRQPYAMLGSSQTNPFEINWETDLLPGQKRVAVRAFVSFKDMTNLVFQTPVTDGLEIAHAPNRSVRIFQSTDLPNPFWSRAGRLQSCTIELPVDPEVIEEAELHVVAWTGGPGEVQEYFKLNEHPYAVADGHEHEVQYSRLKVDPNVLRRGDNRIELLSDTDHHGIEILLPGPALVVRTKE